MFDTQTSTWILVIGIPLGILDDIFNFIPEKLDVLLGIALLEALMFLIVRSAVKEVIDENR